MSKSLIWKVEFDDRARRELRRLDQKTQAIILRYFRERISTKDDPRRFGKPLRHELKGLWRYRIGDCHAICQIQDDKILVLVLGIGHRREIYR